MNITLMAKIWGSLLEKCNVLVTARDIVESANQMLDKLKKRLIKEEARKHVTDEVISALHKSKIKQDMTESNRKEDRAFKEEIFLLFSKKESFCCHKPGHYIKRCRKKKIETSETRRNRRTMIQELNQLSRLKL